MLLHSGCLHHCQQLQVFCFVPFAVGTPGVLVGYEGGRLTLAQRIPDGLQLLWVILVTAIIPGVYS